MSEWYYRMDERVYGPFTEEDLRGKIESGKISCRTLISRDGFTHWLEAGQCREFDSQGLFEKEGGQCGTKVGALFGRKFKSWFGRPEKSRDPQPGSPARSRRRILFWCLGIVLAVVMAGLFVKVAGGRLRRAYARHFATPASSDFSLPKTKNYWLAIQSIEKPANESLKKMTLGKYPLNSAGQFDFSHFTKEDLENLREYYLKVGQTARGVAQKIESLPAAGVDPGLLHYQLELCELWSLMEQANMDFAEIANDLQEQKLCFASPEAYALRFGKPLAGQEEMEARYQEKQRQINEKVKNWRALSELAKEATEHMIKREQEVKTLLSSRYNWEFK